MQTATPLEAFDPRHLGPREGRLLHVMGTEVYIKLTTAETGGRMTLVEVCAQPGVFVPEHTHAVDHELFLVQEGQIRVTVGDEEIIAGVGDTVVGPVDIPHAWYTHGDVPARFWLITTPGGIDGMFEDIAAIPEGAEDAIPQAIAIGAKYGISYS